MVLGLTSAREGNAWGDRPAAGYIPATRPCRAGHSLPPLKMPEAHPLPFFRGTPESGARSICLSVWKARGARKNFVFPSNQEVEQQRQSDRPGFESQLCHIQRG